MSDEKSPVTETGTQTEKSPTRERRDFLRNSMLTAGAIATFAAAESTAAQTCYDAYGNVIKASNSGVQVIDITLDSSNVVLDDFNSILKQLGKLTGCLNCGFNGFDLRFRINPVIRLDTRIAAAANIHPR